MNGAKIFTETVPFLRNFFGGGGEGAKPNIFHKNRGKIGLQDLPEARRKAVLMTLSLMKLGILASRPAFDRGVQGHAPPENFEYQKSRMAISCDLRVILMQKATENCLIGGKQVTKFSGGKMIATRGANPIPREAIAPPVIQLKKALHWDATVMVIFILWHAHNQWFLQTC